MVWNKGLSGNPDNSNYDSRLDYMMGDSNPAKCPESRKKISAYKKANPPMQNPESRRKISESLRKGYANGSIKSQKGCKRSKEACKNMSIAQQKRKQNNFEEWLDSCKKSGYTTHQRHPNQASEMGKVTQRKHPNQSSEVAKRTHKEWKERDPEDYYKKKREYCRKMLDKRMKIKKENPKAYKEMYRNAGVNSFQSILDNSPFYWDGVPFLSNQEREAAKCLLKKPKKGINCHIEIGRKTIDFYPQEDDLQFQGKLVEFHPYDRHILQEEYYRGRKKVIDNSKYKGIELVVITNLEEIRNGSEKRN